MDNNKPYFRDLDKKKHLFVDAIHVHKLEFVCLDTKKHGFWYQVVTKDKSRYPVNLNAYKKVQAYLNGVHGTEGAIQN